MLRQRRTRGGAQALWVGDHWDGFEAKWKELEKDGLQAFPDHL